MRDYPPAYRYAAYFAPAFDSPWWQAGSQWLGRCAVREQPLPQPTVPGLSADEQALLTASPRRYGWHATLKAPFALAPGVGLQALRNRLREVCREQQPFTMPPLKVALLGDFLALVPQTGTGSANRGSDSNAAIDAVARACVVGLHDLAAPLQDEELRRRRAAGLTAEEDALMLRWGYPYVMQRFRFHLSLTGLLRDVAPAKIRSLQDAASRWFASMPPCRFESVALFAQPLAGSEFVLVEYMTLSI